MQFISSVLKEHLSIVLNSGNFSQPSTHACFHPWLWRNRLYPWRKKKKWAQKKKKPPVSFPRGKRICDCKQVLWFSIKPSQLETTRYFPQWSIWWNRGGHHRRQPIGNTPLGTFNHPAGFLHVHLYQVFKLIWRGQRPYSYAKPVRTTVTTGEARQKSGSWPGKFTRWFLRSAFLQQLDTQESKEHHGLLFW